MTARGAAAARKQLGRKTMYLQRARTRSLQIQWFFDDWSHTINDSQKRCCLAEAVGQKSDVSAENADAFSANALVF